MHILKHIYQATVSLVKQAPLLPEWVENAVKRQRQQIALQRFETARLDRIRNPSKYLGKRKGSALAGPIMLPFGTTAGRYQ